MGLLILKWVPFAQKTPIVFRTLVQGCFNCDIHALDAVRLCDLIAWCMKSDVVVPSGSVFYYAFPLQRLTLSMEWSVTITHISHTRVTYLHANECVYQLTCIWEVPLWGIFILSVKHMNIKQTMNWLWPIFCSFNSLILLIDLVFFWMHFLNSNAVLIFSLHT